MPSTQTRLLSAALLLGATAVAQAEPAKAADLGCGTRMTKAEARYGRALHQSGAYDLPPLPAGAHRSRPVRLAFHVVRRSDRSGGIPLARLNQAVLDANAAFAGSGMRFCMASLDYIDDDAFYDQVDTMAEIDALRSVNVVPREVNCYFVEELAYEAGGLNGISSFTFSPVQGIVYRNSAVGLPENSSTVPHELGHYFDLFHTHETAIGLECTDGSNCWTAGDLVCDTPADPGLGPANVDSNCDYVGTTPSPCGGLPYDPQVWNVMSYASPRSCRTGFTQEQKDRAYATLTNLRGWLDAVPCLYSGVPSTGGTSTGPPGTEMFEDDVLLPNDARPGSYFGRAIAMEGGRAIVGAYLDQELGWDAGAAYVFDVASRQQLVELIGSDVEAGDWFGFDVELEGDLAIVTAPYDDDHGINTGAVYGFDVPSGLQLFKLTNPAAAWDDAFGVDAAIAGSKLIVKDDRYHSIHSRGTLHVYDLATLQELYEITNPSGQPLSTIQSLAADGHMAVIGLAGGPGGGAMVYDLDTRQIVWELEPSAWNLEGDNFGASVAIQGNLVAVGAPADNSDSQYLPTGAVYVFDLTTGQEVQYFKRWGIPQNVFGARVDLDGPHLISSGVYVFDVTTGASLFQLQGSDVAPYFDNYGYFVAIQGGRALVGSIISDHGGLDSGSTYVFDLP